MDTQQPPLISLVMPTFNRGRLLNLALESIAVAAANAADAVEVIVVDNASTDDTAAVVHKAMRDFPSPLRYVKETRQGSSQARNCGLEEAAGFYIVFMDDDQVMDRDYLKNIPLAFEETDAVCVGGPVTYYNARDLPRWLQKLSRTIGQTAFGDQVKMLDDSAHKGLMGGNIAFIKSELKAAGAFNVRLGRFGEDAGTGEDLELQDRMRSLGKKVAYHPRLIQYHYLRSERLKTSYWRRYYYDYGRSIYNRAAIESKHAQSSSFPIPLWMLRHLLTKDVPAYLASMFTFDFYKIFRSELEIWVRKGQMDEAWRARKETKLPASKRYDDSDS